jgi:protein unc-13
MNLNEELELINSQETELLNKKTKSKDITPEAQTPPQPSITIQQQQQLHSSNSNIYNQDEYVKLLKKNLERHNSMLFLLHMQNPQNTNKNFFIDEENFSNGSNSPPPPAPNGCDTMASGEAAGQLVDDEELLIEKQISHMNPFHLDIIMENQHRMTQLIKASSVSSPKKTKSDSGLSSMSGFSSFERSPNSPTMFYLNKINQQQQQQQQNAGALAANLNNEPSDYVFNEENLNYIKELSKNVPICSIFENKSMFNPNAAWNENNNAYPDLLKNQQRYMGYAEQVQPGKLDK